MAQTQCLVNFVKICLQQEVKCTFISLLLKKLNLAVTIVLSENLILSKFVSAKYCHQHRSDLIKLSNKLHGIQILLTATLLLIFWCSRRVRVLISSELHDPFMSFVSWRD